MKKIIILAIAVSAAAFIGCNSDKTELSFTNSIGSDGAINDIVWNTSEATWSQTNGYATSSTTEAKEVSSRAGTVDCNVITNTGVYIANVNFPDTGSGSALSLKEGSSNNYRLEATATTTPYANVQK